MNLVQIINAGVYVEMDELRILSKIVMMEIDTLETAVMKTAEKSQAINALGNPHFACQYVEMVWLLGMKNVMMVIKIMVMVALVGAVLSKDTLVLATLRNVDRIIFQAIELLRIYIS